MRQGFQLFVEIGWFFGFKDELIISYLLYRPFTIMDYNRWIIRGGLLTFTAIAERRYGDQELPYSNRDGRKKKKELRKRS